METKWYSERYEGNEIPTDIACKDCKHRKPSVTVRGKTIERYTYADCAKYKTKPLDIIFKKAMCKFHEVDNG